MNLGDAMELVAIEEDEGGDFHITAGIVPKSLAVPVVVNAFV